MPPNLVGLVRRLEKRGLIQRQPHPQDGRAVGLYPTESGRILMQQAEARATALERRVAQSLSEQEQDQLIGLLQRVYLAP